MENEKHADGIFSKEKLLYVHGLSCSFPEEEGEPMYSGVGGVLNRRPY